MTLSWANTPPAINSPDNAEDTYWMSTRMLFTVACRIVGYRFWGTPNALTTSPNGAMFTTGGALVAGSTVAFPGPLVLSDWNTVMLGTPIDVVAGTTYDVTVGPRNRYAANTGTFTGGPVSNNTITASAGRFVVSASATPVFPSTSTNTWYGVDVLIEFASTEVTGGLASGTGIALAATAAVSPSGDVSDGTGTAETAGITVSSNVGIALATGEALQPTIELEGEVHLYSFGPCEPWDPIWNCRIDQITGAAAVSGVALQAASEVLYQLTAQRFGLCNVALRPCRQSCFGSFPWSTWWQYGTYPQPFWWNGTWYNLACGNCPDNSCSCIGLDKTILPGPVFSITEVKLDGVVLVEGVNYRVDNYRELVRIDGELWPFCQDLRLEDTEPNTWSVTAQYGEEVPVLGRMAVGELALEFIKYLTCDDTCALPYGVVDVSRQGVSMSIQSITELIRTGFVQLRICDLFIATANPNHLKGRSAVYDLDGPSPRAVGTT